MDKTRVRRNSVVLRNQLLRLRTPVTGWGISAERTLGRTLSASRCSSEVFWATARIASSSGTFRIAAGNR
jgi:hypothetical protein